VLEAVIDNDVLLKASAYLFIDELEHIVCAPPCLDHSGILSTAQWVCRAWLRRRIDAGTCAPESLTMFEDFIQQVERLEPSEEEQQRAAQLEEFALVEGLPLDVGESLLFAIASLRGSMMITGDKRAIQSAELALPVVTWLTELAGKVACLEQVLSTLTNRLGPTSMRDAVCANTLTDKALTASFECHRVQLPAGWRPEGLSSYIADLRQRASQMLFAGESLQAL
jgi:hypothetical protein